MTRRRRRAAPVPRTAWHPMFLVTLEETLDRRAWQVIGEFLLAKEPGRVDAVVIRRRAADPPPPPRLHTVLTGLRAHTLVHLKGATDELEKEDAAQVLAYAAGYLLAAKLDDPSALTIRVVAPSLTPRFAEQFARLGGELAPSGTPGVHEGHLGPFALRLVETAVACDLPHEELLRLFSPRFLAEVAPLRPVDEAERRLYNLLYRCVAQLARLPEAAMIKDVDLVQKRFEQDIAELLPLMDAATVLKKLPPEQRLAGLAPEQRLAGLAPEQRLAGLSEAEQVLALPDHLLAVLPDDYVATLPPDVQAKVRARRGR